MRVHHCRSAGRGYTVVTGLSPEVQPSDVVQQVTDDAASEGAEAVVVVTPPRSEKDAAMGLHTFMPDGSYRSANGLDAMCAFDALRRERETPVEAVEFRFADHAVAVVAMHNDPHRMEVDLGRPGLDASRTPLQMDRVEAIDGTHTYEIPLGNSGDTIIVTLVNLVGLHAVVFTDALDDVDLPALGGALQGLGASGEATFAHAVKIGEPGVLQVRSWDPVSGTGGPSGFGLGAICAAGVTMCCTVAQNAVQCGDGEMSAGWDGDGHVRLRGTVDETAIAS